MIFYNIEKNVTTLEVFWLEILDVLEKIEVIYFGSF